MTIPIVAAVIRISWVTVEYLYVGRNKVVPNKDWDRNSAKLWDVAHAIEIFGMIMGFMGVLRIQLGTNLIMRVGLILLLAECSSDGQLFISSESSSRKLFL